MVWKQNLNLILGIPSVKALLKNKTANMEEVEQALKKMEADYKYYTKLLDSNEFVINLPIGGV